MTAPAGSDAPRAPTIPHVAALDGLRGVALIGVLLFHADHLQGGFLGVDLFFTLSGFLITSLLLVERERSGTVSLRRFWSRRARRLLPAMLVVVAAASVLARFELRTDELDRFRTQALSALGYVANWAEIVRASDYFAMFDTPSPLDHVWSLAIEEQFYVVWPLLVLLAARRARPRTGVRILVGAGIVASIAASWWVVGAADGVTRAYYGTDTRAASILVGAGLATVTAGELRDATRTERWVAVAAPAALVGLLASWFVVDGSELWLYRWGLVTHALLTAVVVAAVSGPVPSALGRILATRFPVRVGLLSYGLYLWHWPVYLWLDEARAGVSGWGLTVVRVAVTAVLAEVSYRFLESPIRHGRVRLPRPAFTTLAAIAATALVVVAVARPGAGEPLPPVTPVPTPSTTVVAGGSEAPAPSTTTTELPPLDSVTLIGDSQAFTLAARVPAEELGLRVENAANLGCGLSSRAIVMAGEQIDRERCIPILDEVPAQVDAADADVVAVLTGVWEAADQVTDEGVVPFGDPRWAQVVRDDFRAMIEPLTTRHTVVLLTTPCFAAGSQRDEYATEDLDVRVAALNDVLVDVSEELGMETVDLAAHLCPDGEVRTTVDGYVVRPDGVHFDDAGARVVWPWLAGQLRVAAARASSS